MHYIVPPIYVSRLLVYYYFIRSRGIGYIHILRDVHPVIWYIYTHIYML